MNNRDTSRSTRQPTRHHDDGRRLAAFLGDHCDVVCPKCGRVGVVRYHGDGSAHSRSDLASFVCADCRFGFRDLPVRRYGADLLPGTNWFGRFIARVNQDCGICGRGDMAYPEVFGDFGIRHSDHVNVQCRHCQHVSRIKVNWRGLDDNAFGSEPASGICLARSELIAPGKAVWAYNQAHQAELRQYVEAEIRESSVLDFYRECHDEIPDRYFFRLPGWLKSARYRRKILAALDRIDRRLNGDRRSD